MDELFSYLKNKRNLINLLIFLIIILGIPIGIVLLQNQQIIKSRADTVPIQLLLDDNCVVERNGKKVARCTEVTVQLISPLGPPPKIPSTTPDPACILCAAPPEGCSYVGGNCATCGTLVCTSPTPTPTPCPIDSQCGTTPAPSVPPSPAAPTAQITTSSSTDVEVGQSVTFNATLTDLDNNLSKGGIYVLGPDKPGIWQVVGTEQACSGGSCNFQRIWTSPSTGGLYKVVVNAYDVTGYQCSGNIFHSGYYTPPPLQLDLYSGCGEDNTGKGATINIIVGGIPNN